MDDHAQNQGQAGLELADVSWQALHIHLSLPATQKVYQSKLEWIQTLRGTYSKGHR